MISASYISSITAGYTPGQMNDSVEYDIIYLTGFGPFLNYSVNPSQLVVEALNQTLINNNLIYGKILPVDFNEAPAIIKDDIRILDPDLIMLLGLDGTCDAITIELVGINLMFDRTVDNPFKTLRRIQQTGPFFLYTKLKVKESFLDLQAKDIPVDLSCSAGLYVCNTVFYETLNHLSLESINTPIGFIHVPPSKTETTEGMDIDVMKEGILSIMISNING